MNHFSMSIGKGEFDGHYEVSVMLWDRFRLVHVADGWRVYSHCDCDCRLSETLFNSKRAALDAVHDFLKRVEEIQLKKSDSPTGAERKS